MAEDVKISSLVCDIVDKLKDNPSTKFSKADFYGLVYGVLQDPCFKTEKFVIKNGEIIKEDISINGEMRKFLDKLLKHAGMAKSEEREAVIDSFAYGINDVAWVADAVDEAMWLYAESGKNMRVFRDKLRQLSFKKVTRSGAHEGKIGYKKTVTDKEAALSKKKANKNS